MAECFDRARGPAALRCEPETARVQEVRDHELQRARVHEAGRREPETARVHKGRKHELQGSRVHMWLGMNSRELGFKPAGQNSRGLGLAKPQDI